jgi:hypothetical protein
MHSVWNFKRHVENYTNKVETLLRSHISTKVWRYFEISSWSGHNKHVNQTEMIRIKKKFGQFKISNTQGDIRICVVTNLFFSLMTYVIYCEQHEHLLKWKSSWSSHNLNKHFEHKVKQTSYSKIFERKKHADGGTNRTSALRGNCIGRHNIYQTCRM